MNRLFSNGPLKDFVYNQLARLISSSSRLHLAAPYFTMAEPIVNAARAGKSVQLLIGLNSATSPEAVCATHGIPNLAVRYLTHRFHAKIYVFDDAALLGSSNLTDGGLMSNREAVICLDQREDIEAVEEVRGLFLELWDSAQVLTTEKLNAFKHAYASIRRQGPDPDTIIEQVIGRAQPINIHVESQTKPRERIFLEELRRRVYEQYRPSFDEVTQLLAENSLRRPEFEDIGIANETNRFLNWVRLTYVVGDEAWQSAPLRSQDERQMEILRLGREWVTTANNRVPEDYIAWLGIVQRVFGRADAIVSASKDELMQGLLSLHAFIEQLRFVKGGVVNLPAAFWSANNQDVTKVKETLVYLLYGPNDFIQRLHDVLYDPRMKLKYFGQFCALELYGTIKPEECPPMNGRMAKALRYLGFDVRGA